MKIHEYQAKVLFNEYQIPVLEGEMIDNFKDARKVAEKIKGTAWVVKAQIHAGGRGKGGGVKVVNSLNDVESVASEILGMTLITHQTGIEGKKVEKILIEKACDIDKEFYLSLVLDRKTGRIVIMTSTEGGMDIETVAKNSPEKIMKAEVNPSIGFTPYIGRKLAFGLGLEGDLVKQAEIIFRNAYKLYCEKDATILEINPLVKTKDNKLVALDGKMNFDDNALFRHTDIVSMRDFTEESTEEVEASKFGLNYIKLDGNIGCLVNGAGLAMATMDIIKLYGGTPANFLDVGGGATKEAVSKAFSLILKDKNVKAILVNLFGGIMKCDVVANGVVEAAKELKLEVPLVVRLEGTNVELGKKILKESGLSIISASTFEDAARKVVEASQKNLKN